MLRALEYSAASAATFVAATRSTTETIDSALATAGLWTLSALSAWYAYGYIVLWLHHRTGSSLTSALLRLAPRAVRSLTVMGLATSIVTTPAVAQIDEHAEGLTTSPTPASLLATVIETPPHSPILTQPSTHTYVVRPGDTLWSVATALNPNATTAQLTDAVHELWATNAHVIGNDADLILPGQELTIPHR